jgi:hypothetical protein
MQVRVVLRNPSDHTLDGQRATSASALMSGVRQ